ncbi:hypothetical protein AGMMS49983_02470 [Clostridia bacterium]|nr:hypothetical protein AGMMS49983_02470 [Clostridia bacterium]
MLNNGEIKDKIDVNLPNYGNIGLYKGVNDAWSDAQLYQDLAAHVGW